MFLIAPSFDAFDMILFNILGDINYQRIQHWVRLMDPLNSLEFRKAWQTNLTGCLCPSQISFPLIDFLLLQHVCKAPQKPNYFQEVQSMTYWIHSYGWILLMNHASSCIYNSCGLMLGNFAFQRPPKIARKLLICYWVQIQGRGVSIGQIISLINQFFRAHVIWVSEAWVLVGGFWQIAAGRFLKSLDW